MKQFYDVYADQPKLAALPRLLPQDATGVFKDSYPITPQQRSKPHSESACTELRAPFSRWGES
jgi:hypothetical protein